MPFSIIMRRFPAGGEEQTETKEVAGAVLRIGRGTDNDLQLDDDAVQPKHATIHEVSGVYILRDLGDGTQTLVNDKAVKEVILTAKGTIRIGPYLLEFARATPTSALRIAGKHLREVFTTDEAASLADTLVLPQSPLAHAPSPGGPDAAQPLEPTTEPRRDDADKKKVIPPRSKRPS